MDNTWNPRFLIRSAQLADLDSLYQLSLSNSLLNLPADKEILSEKILKSKASFACEKNLEDRQFIFVLEEQENKQVAGTSTIFSEYADKNHPLYYFTVYGPDDLPDDACVKAGHQLLRLGKTVNGISALGGLVVDPRYRGMPEKRGKQISLIRFLFIAMFPEFFHTTILSELMAPTDPDGSNPFWNAIGQKFSGLDYNSVFQHARMKDRSFIEEYFPNEDIILSPESAYLHRNIDSVNDTGKAQQHMITTQGFKYNHRVDPMDGGLQYTASVHDIKIVQKSGCFYCDQLLKGEPECSALVGTLQEGEFLGCQHPVSFRGDTVLLHPHALEAIGISPGEQLFVSQI